MQNKPTPFGEFLKLHRRRQNWSIRRLADKLGIATTVISRVENGKEYVIGKEYWPALVEALCLGNDYHLSIACRDSQPTVIRPWEFEGGRRDAATLIARAVSLMPSLTDEALDEFADAIFRLTDRKT